METMELALSTKDWIDWAGRKAGRGEESPIWINDALLSYLALCYRLFA